LDGDVASAVQHGTALQRILQIRNSHHRTMGKLFTFRDLFSMTRIFDCSDDHDRVYGLLSLVELSDTEDLFIDYAEKCRVSRPESVPTPDQEG
jgi:hypothetical protein